MNPFRGSLRKLGKTIVFLEEFQNFVWTKKNEETRKELKDEKNLFSGCFDLIVSLWNIHNDFGMKSPVLIL